MNTIRITASSTDTARSRSQYTAEVIPVPRLGGSLGDSLGDSLTSSSIPTHLDTDYTCERSFRGDLYQKRRSGAAVGSPASEKRISDRDGPVLLSVRKVFTPKNATSEFQGAIQNKSIPPVDVVSTMK